MKAISTVKAWGKAKAVAVGFHLSKGMQPVLTPPRTTITLIEEEALADSYAYFKDRLSGVSIFTSVQEVHNFLAASILPQLEDGYFLEFGYYTGGSASRLAPALRNRHTKSQYYAFDSFFGLREQWSQSNMFIGSFSLDGVTPPAPEGISLVSGWVEETLDPWLLDHPGRIAFAHFDMDLYGPTRYALERVYQRLTPGSILCFDEFHGYHGWREHEFRALAEVIPESEYTLLALGPQQIVIAIS